MPPSPLIAADQLDSLDHLYGPYALATQHEAWSVGVLVDSDGRHDTELFSGVKMPARTCYLLSGLPNMQAVP